VTFGGEEPVVAAERAEHGQARLVERLPEELFVGIGADLVEDHAGEVQIGIEGPEPVDDRGGRAGHRRRVDDEQNGRPEELGDMGRRRQLAATGGTVEQAHDTLDHRDVRAGGPVAEERGDQVRAAQEGVEISPGPAGG